MRALKKDEYKLISGILSQMNGELREYMERMVSLETHVTIVKEVVGTEFHRKQFREFIKELNRVDRRVPDKGRRRI